MSIDSPAKYVEVFGLRVFSDDLSKIPLRGGRCATVTTISPNSYGMSEHDADFKSALRAADYLVLDGVYFGLASIVLKRQVIQANQGPMVFDHFMDRLQSVGGKAFFLGSTEATLAKIRARGAELYPRIRIETYSPPYKPAFDAADNAAMLARINAFEPDVLFVGMTAPKQEKWAHEHRDQLRAGLVISIGAVFDWFAGNERAIAPIWWKLKLAWLVRTVHRPAILKRYPNIFLFFWHLLLASVGIKRFKHG